MKIYYIPNRQQVRANLFYYYLKSNFPRADHIKGKYALPPELLNKLLETRSIINSFRNLQTISTFKKNACLKELEKLPENIRVIKSLADISVDFALEANSEVYYFEFHENQHRIDSNRISKSVYDNENKPIVVPRYIQRLLRDVWRWKFLPNYKIVWFDWFEQNPNFPIGDLISENKFEYSLKGKFKISDI